MKPGVDDPNCNTETELPGDVTCRSFPRLLGNLVLQVCLVIAPYRHPAHLWVFTVIRRLGKIPSVESNRVSWMKNVPGGRNIRVDLIVVSTPRSVLLIH